MGSIPPCGLEVVLVEPQIPPNTGNIARLCAAVHAPLHLVEPLGFRIDDKHLKRAGLDYWPWVQWHRHRSLEALLQGKDEGRFCFFSTRASTSYLEARFQPGEYLVFGSETEGLPADLLERHAARSFRIPILRPQVRSLNLSSAVAIVLYEALRQLGRL